MTVTVNSQNLVPYKIFLAVQYSPTKMLQQSQRYVELAVYKPQAPLQEPQLLGNQPLG